MSTLTQYQAFLATNTAAATAYKEVIAKLEAMRVTTRDNQGVATTYMPTYALHGGAIRDITVSGAAADPRNFNITVDVRLLQLREVVRTFPDAESLPNGLVFTHGGKDFVVNALRHAPEFRRNLNPKTFTTLMDSVFLSLEALAVTARAGGQGEDPIVYEVIDQGYSQSISSNTIEIKNPRLGDPTIQLVRLAEYAKKYPSLSFGESVEDFVAEYDWEASKDERLLKAQEIYYRGSSTASPAEVRATLDNAIIASHGRKAPPPRHKPNTPGSP